MPGLQGAVVPVGAAWSGGFVGRWALKDGGYLGSPPTPGVEGRGHLAGSVHQRRKCL